MSEAHHVLSNHILPFHFRNPFTFHVLTIDLYPHCILHIRAQLYLLYNANNLLSHWPINPHVTFPWNTLHCCQFLVLVTNCLVYLCQWQQLSKLTQYTTLTGFCGGASPFVGYFSPFVLVFWVLVMLHHHKVKQSHVVNLSGWSCHLFRVIYFSILAMGCSNAPFATRIKLLNTLG